MKRRAAGLGLMALPAVAVCALALGSLRHEPRAVAQPRQPTNRPPTKQLVPARCHPPRVARVPWQDAVQAEDHYDERAGHIAIDTIVNPGADAQLRGKFAYGRTSHDLEGEWVVALVRDRPCIPWTEVGRALTDRDGRVMIRAPGTLFASAGRHEVALVVPADGSVALGSVWVLPRGAEVVVFDIDGTLTTGDDQVVQQLLTGAEPQMYRGANHVARAWASSGRQPVYVTGRPYSLQDVSRRWLDDHGFPPGPIRTTDSLSDARTDRAHVGRFKRDYLLDVLARTGVVVAAAYGNALTDVCAYSEAGIAPTRTFIVGPYGGSACDRGAATQAVRTYPAHLMYARQHLLARR